MPDAPELGSASWDEIAFQAAECLGEARQLLEQLRRTVRSAPTLLTFIEVDDAMQCVTRALLALETERTPLQAEQ